VVELPPDDLEPEDHARLVRPMLRRHQFEDDVIISGIAMSDIGRRLMRDPVARAVDAVKQAIADAGLTLDDIDGLSTYPGSNPPPGMGEGGVPAVAGALGIRPTWYNGGHDTFGPSGSVIAAMIAVTAGLARHVVC